jgi:N-acetylmuramoyl-L-alanine amidase
MKIALDIGHASGTSAAGNGMTEHEYCSKMSALLAEKLADRHEVKIIDFPHMTNAADLAATVKTINADEFDLSISLHCDYYDNPAARGAHVCYFSTTGKRYAEAVARYLCALMPGRAEKTVRRPGLYVLAETECPAVLIEFGFVSNEADAKKMVALADQLAAAVVAGINSVAT